MLRFNLRMWVVFDVIFTAVYFLVYRLTKGWILKTPDVFESRCVIEPVPVYDGEKIEMPAAGERTSVAVLEPSDFIEIGGRHEDWLIPGNPIESILLQYQTKRREAAVAELTQQEPFCGFRWSPRACVLVS